MSGDGSPTIRDATLSDAPAMLEVIQSAFGDWPAVDPGVPPLEHLRTKMTPPGPVPHHVAVELDGRIAATELRWVCQLQVGSETYPAETGADLAVHRDFQGRGIYRLIKAHDHARLSADSITGFGMLSNAPQVRHLNEPDMISRRLTTWARPFRRRSFAAVHYREGGPGQLLRTVVNAARSSRGSDPGGRIEVLERFDSRTDALWEEARNQFDVIPYRDADYLNWRFTPALSGETTILGVLDRERAVAYAVVRVVGDRGHLLDWLWTPDGETARPLLLRAAIARVRALGARGIECWLPEGHGAEPLLEAAGFARVGTQHLLFGAREQQETPDEVLDICEDPATTMHLSMSDFDHA